MNEVKIEILMSTVQETKAGGSQVWRQPELHKSLQLACTTQWGHVSKAKQKQTKTNGHGNIDM